MFDFHIYVAKKWSGEGTIPISCGANRREKTAAYVSWAREMACLKLIPDYVRKA
jgi:hypothetical protein